MGAIIASVGFISVITLYLLVIEIFYTIFRFTGLNEDKARFQTLSLLTTAGYTTSESEDILTSDKRRKVAMFAMFFGYIFSVVLASSIINIIISFVGNENKTANAVNVLIIFMSVLSIFFITRSKTVTGWVNKLIKNRIEKYISKKQRINPLYVVDTHGRFVICEVLVTNVPDALEHKTLIEAEVRKKYDISVLTIKQGNEIRTMDATKDIINTGDRVIVFGHIENIKTLFHTDIL